MLNLHYKTMKHSSHPQTLVRKSSPQGKSGAFTIIELLVVIVIIAILAAITLVSYASITNRATVASLQSDLDNAAKILKMDQSLNSSFPSTLSAANDGKGIQSSSGTTLSYVVNNNADPKLYCLSATKNSMTYRVTESNTPSLGDCVNYLPVLYLDANNPNSYPGTGTTWTDLSGNGNNGTLYNGVGYTTNGGKALTFDKVDDYVSVADSASMDSSSDEITIIAWINPAPDNGTGPPWKREGVWYSYYHSGHLFSFTTYDTSPQVLESTGSLNGGQWNQLVMVYSNLTSTKKIYVNNVLVTQDAAVTGQMTGGSVLELGRVYTGYFKGSIGVFQIFSRALSAAEVTQNFNLFRGRYGI
jgi:prepilin-type N-terminal cleavage/methylation domain-containing protein